MMKIHKRYITPVANSESVFDMAAVCYIILESNISNPVKFISEYVDESSSSINKNPNYQILRKFSDQIRDVLKEYSEFDFTNQKLEVVELLQNINLDSFQGNTENQLSVIYTLLSTIDSIVSYWDMQRIVERTPLNNRGKSKDLYFVYFTSSEPLHKELILKIGRKRKQNPDFGENFSHLLFLQKKMLPNNANAPEICYLHCKRHDKQYCIKVAVITGVTGKHFKILKTIGSTQIIQYINEVQNEIGNKIWEKMEIAIKQGAEFIILPEFCVSEAILKYIKGRIAEWHKNNRRASQLIAIFPGSTWITSEKNVHNNVQIILDAWGREKGRYYKNTPYRKLHKSGRGYEESEGLSNPGYRTTIFYVEGIGYVLPATCRDVIDGTYTDYLVSKFCPTLLFVPAWSSSGNSFRRPMKTYAADYFTNSVFCNACGALSRNASIMGGATIIKKQGTITDGLFKEVKRPIECQNVDRKKCNRCCSYLMHINFDPEYLYRKERIMYQAL